MTSPYSKFIWSEKNADFGRHFGFERLKLHHFVLPANSEAEINHGEEKFFFLISGLPQLLNDKSIYQLKPNFAVGLPKEFPSTRQDVEFFVVGSRPEVAPIKNIGNSKVEEALPPFVVDCTKLKASSGWHYPGDSETFSDYVRLSNSLSLETYGVGFEQNAPGKRSAFPHAHSCEEEFAFILSGKATIWMNGYLHEVLPGQAVAFLPGTHVAHAVLNKSDEPMTYVIVGEAKIPEKKDKIFYPEHPFRNEQCKKLNSLWEETPSEMAWGSQSGRPKIGIPEHLAFKLVGPQEVETVLKIFNQSLAYFEKVEGSLPTRQMVEHAIKDVPEKKSTFYLKEFLLVEYKDQPVGVVDLHLHHPEEGIAYIGLLLVTDQFKGRGLGRRIYELTEHYAKMVFKIKQIRLGISEDNDVRAFWTKLGFTPNGKAYDWKGENKVTKVAEFAKEISP